MPEYLEVRVRKTDPDEPIAIYFGSWHHITINQARNLRDALHLAVTKAEIDYIRDNIDEDGT